MSVSGILMLESKGERMWRGVLRLRLQSLALPDQTFATAESRITSGVATVLDTHRINQCKGLSKGDHYTHISEPGRGIPHSLFDFHSPVLEEFPARSTTCRGNSTLLMLIMERVSCGVLDSYCNRSSGNTNTTI